MRVRMVAAVVLSAAIYGCGNVHTPEQDCCAPSPIVPPPPVVNPPPVITPRQLYMELSIQRVDYSFRDVSVAGAIERCIDPDSVFVVFDTRVVGFSGQFTIDWDYGDGNTTRFHISPTTAHTYRPAVGSWVITATVTDTDGRFLTQSIPVVLPPNPLRNFQFCS